MVEVGVRAWVVEDALHFGEGLSELDFVEEHAPECQAGESDEDLSDDQEAPEVTGAHQNRLDHDLQIFRLLRGLLLQVLRIRRQIPQLLHHLVLIIRLIYVLQHQTLPPLRLLLLLLMAAAVAVPM